MKHEHAVPGSERTVRADIVTDSADVSFSLLLPAVVTRLARVLNHIKSLSEQVDQDKAAYLAHVTR